MVGVGGATSAPAVPLHGRRTATSLAAAQLPPSSPVISAGTPPGTALQLRAAAVTHAGRVRPNNEDALLTRIPEDDQALLSRGALFAVADGVGGHAAGEVASRTAVDLLGREYFSPRAPHQTEAALSQAMHAANMAVYNLAHGAGPARRAMQTTLTALALAGRQAYIAHAGDTRAYLCRKDALSQLTGDHSEAAELLRLRLITPQQALTHPRRSVLTRALGGTPQLRPDFQRTPIQAGDRFLLCTDGLWGEVSSAELARALAANPDSPAAVCEHLLALALARGGQDNVTLLLVDVLDPGPPAPSQTPGRIGRLLAGLRGGG